ncbi:MAG: AsmA-like C-terminal region-containing protein [Planctomycetota bacterium]
MGERPGLLTRLNSYVRWLLFALLVCAAGAMVCRQVVINWLDDAIRARLQSMVAAHYPDMDVRIQGARRIEGRGIEIRGLSISTLHEETAHRELLSIDELFLQCNTDLSELLGGKPRGEHLILRRLKLNATCCRDGEWNVARLLPLPNFGGSIPSIVLEDAALELRDASRPAGQTWVCRNIHITAQSKSDARGEPRWRFTGNVQGDHFKHVELKGLVNAVDGSWSAGGTIDGLEMSERLLHVLPKDMAQYASLLATLRARAHFQFRLARTPDQEEPIRVNVWGELSEGRVDDPRLPLPLTELQGKVFISNQEIRIDNAVARSGSTRFRLTCRYAGFLGAAPTLRLDASIRQLPLDERLYESLPKRFREDWNNLAPAGIVDADIEVRLRDNHLVPDVTVTCRDVSFAYHKFPFRMRQGNGTIRWVDDTLRIRDFTALAGNTVVHMAGRFKDPGPRFTGRFDVHTDGSVPLDHELLSAMNEAGQRIVRSLHPTGGVVLTQGHIEKQTPDGEPRSRWELALKDCSIQYDQFPYAIQQVSGRLVLDDGHWKFSELRGRHGSSYITAGGMWEPLENRDAGGSLTLDFNCWDVPLNDSLRNAVGKFNSGAERFWDSLRPRGTLDYASISFRHNTVTDDKSLEISVEKWPSKQNVAGRSITIHPSWFSVKLNDCTGKLHFADGQFRLINVAAQREDSRVELAGHGRILPRQQWEITLSRFIVDSLRVDHELTSALPPPMQAGIRQLKYRGALSLDGSCWFRGGERKPSLAGWDLLLDIEDGVIEKDLKLEHIHGGIHLQGEKNAAGFQCLGHLEIDSLMTPDIQVSQIRGPLLLDSKHLVLGSQAATGKHDTPPQQITAKVMGGDAELDARVTFDAQPEFAMNLSLSDVSVARLARSLLDQQHDVSGKGFAVVSLSGTEAGLHTLQGTGQLRLREADIYELPVMARLLNLLSLRPPANTAFTSSDVDFRIQGEQIYLDRVDFTGNAISLKGHGWMDLNNRVNLDFYALVGRQELQFRLLRMLLAEASKNILAIQVVGNIDNPQVIKKPLPELDDTLQRLFPEADPRTAER